jgi:hypothetical protein
VAVEDWYSIHLANQWSCKVNKRLEILHQAAALFPGLRSQFMIPIGSELTWVQRTFRVVITPATGPRVEVAKNLLFDQLCIQRASSRCHYNPLHHACKTKQCHGVKPVLDSQRSISKVKVKLWLWLTVIDSQWPSTWMTVKSFPPWSKCRLSNSLLHVTAAAKNGRSADT